MSWSLIHSPLYPLEPTSSVLSLMITRTIFYKVHTRNRNESNEKRALHTYEHTKKK